MTACPVACPGTDVGPACADRHRLHWGRETRAEGPLLERPSSLPPRSRDGVGNRTPAFPGLVISRTHSLQHLTNVHLRS